MTEQRRMPVKLEAGEFVINEYRVVAKYNIFKSYPGTLCLTNKRFIWYYDDFGGMTMDWESNRWRSDNIYLAKNIIILKVSVAQRRKHKIVFNNEHDAIQCYNDIRSLLEPYDS